MDAKRWSLLWTFAAGCLSGAVLIGWRSSDVEKAAPRGSHALPSTSSHEANATARGTSPPEAEAAEITRPERPSAPGGDETSNEAGNSVADVLARLEDEYRRRNTPALASEAPAVASASASASAPAPAAPGSADIARALPNEPSPEPAPRQVTNAAREATVAKAQTSEPAVVVAAAPAPVQASLAQASVAAAPAESTPTKAAADEPVTTIATAEDVRNIVDSGQERLTEQLQQIALVQQASLVQQVSLSQQLAWLQYLQLAQSTTPRLVVPAPAPATRRPNGGRIVDVLPPTFSATDNPWGFTYPVPVLLH